MFKDFLLLILIVRVLVILVYLDYLLLLIVYRKVKNIQLVVVLLETQALR